MAEKKLLELARAIKGIEDEAPRGIQAWSAKEAKLFGRLDEAIIALVGGEAWQDACNLVA